MMQSKITWVLLRGLTREHRHWEQFPELLQKAFPDSQILLPDLPGSGVHHKQLSPLSIDAIMEKVRAEVLFNIKQTGPEIDADALTTNRNSVYLLGLSLGAMVAIQWATRYPNDIAGAVLMNTSMRGMNPLFHRIRPQNYPVIIRNFLLSNNIQRQEKAILRLTSNTHANDSEILARWVDYARESGMTRYNSLRQLLAASRYSAPAAKPAIPLLVLNGLGDSLVNPKCSQKIAESWQLDLASHPEAGHDLTLDAGQWVCEQLLDWFDRQPEH